MNNLKNISIGTWVRLILLIGVIVCNGLSSFGISPSQGSTVWNIILIIATALISLLSYWKNNSFTEAAITADKLLQELKSLYKE